MQRRGSAIHVIIGLALALAAGTAGWHQALADSGCRIAKGESPVAKACVEGGLMKAKQTMRAMIKEARAAGARFECDDCHSDDSAYDKLTPEARDKFAKLLASVQRR
jgi:hypothetical protein